MRLPPKKTEQILLKLLGPEGAPLITELNAKDNVSEFDLATKTKKDIKVIRRLLYILYNNNLVSFTRKKDKDKGWYIYYWTIVPENVHFNYVRMRKEELIAKTEELASEQQELFFVCPGKCVRLNFDQAMDFEFHCPECGKLLLQDDSAQKIEQIKKDILEITEELEKFKEQKKNQKKHAAIRKKEVLKKKKEKVKKVKKATPAKKTPSKSTEKTSSTKKAAPKKANKKKANKKKAKKK